MRVETSSHKLTIVNDITEISRVAAFIDDFCTAHGAAADIIFKINLAVEEALVNTITYGFADKARHAIEIEMAAEDNTIVLRIVDDGVAFDPLEAATPDLNASVDERRVGGLGVFLMTTTMDDVRYVREGGQNKLTLRKRF